MTSHKSRMPSALERYAGRPRDACWLCGHSLGSDAQCLMCDAYRKDTAPKPVAEVLMDPATLAALKERLAESDVTCAACGKVLIVHPSIGPTATLESHQHACWTPNSPPEPFTENA
jgi:hypothetical protein